MSVLNADQITDLIVIAIPDASVELEDLTGTSDHWSATVISAAFDGLSRVRRHKLVYAALAEPLKGPIHALALKTLTPGEAEG
jgi:stress-induced morphogen